MFNWIDSDEEEDQGEEGTLLDALEKESGWESGGLSSGPDSIGFCPGRWIRARVWTQNPRVRVRMHSHHQMLKTSCRCVGLWRSDVFTPLKNKRISMFEHRADSKFCVPQEICNVKPELEAFDLTMADSDTESAVGPATTKPRACSAEVGFGESGTQQVEVPTQEPESEAEGCPSEHESLEDNESEQAAEEEDVECGEPFQDILFVPERRSMATGFESLDMVDLERVFEVRALVMKSVPRIHERGISRRHEDQFGGIRKGQLASNVETTTRGWKLFMLLPRMLLCRPPRGGLIPRKRLEEKVGGIQRW